MAAALALPAAAGPIDWAHQKAGAVQSNGAVTVKTLSGGAYNATGNPSGAVAKVNQNAATQPPTVIIQATNNGYAEVVPLVVRSAVVPACPPGYSSIFSRTNATGQPTHNVFNIGGTRWSFGTYSLYSSTQWGFLLDHSPSPAIVVSSNYSGGVIGLYESASSSALAANLCVK